MAALVSLLLCLMGAVVIYDTVALKNEISLEQAGRVKARTATCYLLRGLIVQIVPPQARGASQKTSDPRVNAALQHSALANCDAYGRQFAHH